MLFRTYGQVVLTLHERHSRLLIARRPPGKAADPIAQAMASILAPLPPQWRQSVTFDNGTEFARHHQLHALGIQTFFCDVRSPWQKGGVENAIGRMRRFLPRKTDLATLTQERFCQLVQAYNNTPRKCLGYNTPAEVFSSQVLHFKCESTFLLSQERRVGAGTTGRGTHPSHGLMQRFPKLSFGKTVRIPACAGKTVSPETLVVQTRRPKTTEPRLCTF